MGNSTNFSARFLALALVLTTSSCLRVSKHEQLGSGTPFFPASSYVNSSQIKAGDMILDVKRISRVSGFSAGFNSYASRPWPGGILPVRFWENVPEDMKMNFFAACMQWQAVANVRCVEQTSESTYMYLTAFSGQGCHSEVGYAGEGTSRFMNMAADGCNGVGTFVHELGHMFGVMHEHQRSDRDRYIDVDFSRIQPGWDTAYTIFSNPNEEKSSEYDFMSIMHYPANSAAIDPNLPIMTPKPGFGQFAVTMGTTIYTTQRPTALDGQGMARIYGGPTGGVVATHSLRILIKGDARGCAFVYPSSEAGCLRDTTLVFNTGQMTTIDAFLENAGNDLYRVDFAGDCFKSSNPGDGGKQAHMVIDHDQTCQLTFTVETSGGSTSGGSTSGGSTSGGSSSGGSTSGSSGSTGNPPPPPPPASIRIGAGQLSLAVGRGVSAGSATLQFQGDGNLVAYVGGNPVWASNSTAECGNGPQSADFQGDGNLVIYAAAGPCWASHTDGRGASLLLSEGAPYFAILDGAGNPL